MKYRAAAVQFDPVLGEVEANTARLLALDEEAARSGARVIVNPEMAPAGYCFRDRQEVAPCVEPVPGPFTERLAEITTCHGCFIVSGLGELDPQTGLYYNTAVIVGPDGYLGKYRKTHLFMADARWAVEGDLGFPVWDTPFGRIGVEICMDATYPETGRLLTLAGAEVICFPTNWVGSTCPDYRWISQAFENGVYWIAADRSGAERGMQFMGGSCIVDPDGTVQAVAAEGERIVYAEIDMDRTRAHRFDRDGPEDKLADRRPELYREMLQSTYTWSPTSFHTLYGASGLPEPRTSTVGVVQFQPEPGAVDQNLGTVERLLAGDRPELLILPELALTGFPPAGEDWTGLAPEVTHRLAELAAASGSLIVTSVADQGDEGAANAVVLVGADGVLDRQAKRHLSCDDRSWAVPGSDPLRTIDTPAGRLGLIAGYDALFWETVRVLATQGADLICVAAALRWPTRQLIGNTGLDWIHWRAKAWESSAVLAIANYPEPDHAGESGIFIPDVEEDGGRELVADRGEARFLSTTIDTGSTFIREKRGLSWRRMQWYRPMVETRNTAIHV